jgi:ribonuclease BN (tRNA processing enzyme)
MRLTVVGASGAWSTRPGHASSCYLVEHADRAVVLDLGQGAFAELSRYRDPAALDAVMVSHLHPDHLVDLVPLRHFIKYGGAAGQVPALHGPAELRQRIAALTGDEGFLADLPGAPLSPGAFDVAGWRVAAGHVTHIPDSYAFRLALPARSGPGLVYSGDCAVADDLLPLIRPGDTLLSEAFYGASAAGGPLHMTAAQAASAAARGGAARLVLTHVSERETPADVIAAARAVFDGEVLLAVPGLVIDLDAVAHE